MIKLNNTEAELKKSIAYKKKRVILYAPLTKGRVKKRFTNMFTISPRKGMNGFNHFSPMEGIKIEQ